MRHQVKDDVNGQRIGDLFGIPAEIGTVFPLPFPAITHVAGVNCQDHDPPLVIEQGADVHLLGTFAPKNPMRRGLRIIRVKVFVPKLHRRHAQIEDALKDRMVRVQLHPATIGHNALNLTGNPLPL